MSSHHALRAVWGTSATDVWAVGSAGTVLHFDGKSWLSTPVGTNRTLSAVGGSGRDDVWIAGTSSTIYRSKGLDGGVATFTDVALTSPPVERSIYALWARAPEDVWIGGACHAWAMPWRSRVGGSGDAGGAVAWTKAGSCGQNDVVSAIWGSSTSVWIAGTEGNVLRTTDFPSEANAPPVWTEFDSQSIRELLGIWGSGDDDVWIVGRGGTIRHFIGRSVLEYVEPPTTSDLYALWGAARDDIWAVGQDGTIFHYDGRAWLPKTAKFPYGTPHLYGVWGSGPDDVWVVGEGVILRLTKPSPDTTGADQ